jgi:DNA polymerase-1
MVFRSFYAGTTGLEPFFVYLNNTLSKIAKSGAHVVLVGDAPGKTWRHELCAEYKQNRTSTPSELIELLRTLPDEARKRGFCWLALSGWEADDLVFTIAKTNPLSSADITIVAADKDLLVLLDCPGVRIWDNARGAFVTQADVVKKFGVPPALVPDLLALAGDSSDNIPGVPKIGLKTASSLLNQYGSLKGLLGSLDKLPNDHRSNSLRQNVESARLSYSLVQLRHAPISAEDLGYRVAQVRAESDPMCVIKEALQYGWLVYSPTTIASVSHWAYGKLSDYLLQLSAVRLISHDDNTLIPDAENIDVLHHLLYGHTAPPVPDKEIYKHADLWQKMQQDLLLQRCARAYYWCDRSLPAVLRQMERRGARIDLQRIEGLRTELSAQLIYLQDKIYGLAGRQFLISSPQQLAQVLNNQMRLTNSKKTDVLTLGAIDHPIASSVLEYRHISKLINTYIDPLSQQATPESRIHTRYTLTVTKTGRLSSLRPNLQNIPIKTELGRRLRSAFIASPGCTLVAADYDQVELRLLAGMAPIPELAEKLRHNIDWHAHVSQILFGDTESRRRAKAVTFGLVYGMSTFGLKQMLGVDSAEAERIKQMYYGAFPGMEQYHARQIHYAKTHGYVTTLWGRRCYVQSGQEMARQAINASIQGTAADIIKQRMQGLPYLILQVHDELVAEVPNAEVLEVSRAMKERMEVEVLGVPLTVTVKTGANWADLQPLDTSVDNANLV